MVCCVTPVILHLDSPKNDMSICKMLVTKQHHLPYNFQFPPSPCQPPPLLGGTFLSPEKLRGKLRVHLDTYGVAFHHAPAGVHTETLWSTNSTTFHWIKRNEKHWYRHKSWFHYAPFNFVPDSNYEGSINVYIVFSHLFAHPAEMNVVRPCLRNGLWGETCEPTTQLLHPILSQTKQPKNHHSINNLKNLKTILTKMPWVFMAL